MTYSERASARGDGRAQLRALARAVAAVAALSVAGSAWAGDKQAADRLFEEGRLLMQDGKVEQASAKFEASLQAEPSVGALVNLARCHELGGKPATAVAEYRRAALMADAEGQPDRAKAARKLAAALEPKLSRVTVMVAEPVDGLVVRLDGKPLAASELGTPLPVDPGKAQLEARAPGYQSWSGSVEVGPDGDAKTVAVPRLEAAPDGALASASSAGGTLSGEAAGSGPGDDGGGPRPDDAAGGDATPTSWSGQHTAALVLGGVGVAGLVVGSAFGLVASSQWDDALSYCNDENLDDCGDEAGPLSQDATTSATLSTVGFVVGGACVATGLILWLTAPSAAEPATEARWRLVPAVGPTGIWSALEGRF